MLKEKSLALKVVKAMKNLSNQGKEDFEYEYDGDGEISLVSKAIKIFWKNFAPKGIFFWILFKEHFKELL